MDPCGPGIDAASVQAELAATGSDHPSNPVSFVLPKEKHLANRNLRGNVSAAGFDPSLSFSDPNPFDSIADPSDDLEAPVVLSPSASVVQPFVLPQVQSPRSLSSKFLLLQRGQNGRTSSLLSSASSCTKLVGGTEPPKNIQSHLLVNYSTAKAVASESLCPPHSSIRAPILDLPPSMTTPNSCHLRSPTHASPCTPPFVPSPLRSRSPTLQPLGGTHPLRPPPPPESSIHPIPGTNLHSPPSLSDGEDELEHPCLDPIYLERSAMLGCSNNMEEHPNENVHGQRNSMEAKKAYRKTPARLKPRKNM